jgi:hypothetical protein
MMLAMGNGGLSPRAPFCETTSHEKSFVTVVSLSDAHRNDPFSARFKVICTVVSMLAPVRIRGAANPE